jgi:hypothetical protein
MSFRNWLPGFAFGLALFLAPFVLGQEVEPEPDRPRENQAASPTETPSTSASAAPKEGASNPNDQNNKPGEKDYPQKPTWDWSRYIAVTPSDTSAQWIMAIFGIIATGVSIAAVILLKMTLTATREAAEYGAEMVELTKDTAKRQLRAYMCISRTRVEWQNNRIIQVMVVFRNTGQTPARDIIMWGMIDPGHKDSFEIPENYNDGSRGTVGADGEYTHQGQTKPLDEETWRQVRAREIPLWLWGELSYDDIFGQQKRSTPFRLKLHEREDVLFPVTEGNETT